MSHSKTVKQNILICFLSNLLKHSKKALNIGVLRAVKEVLLAQGCFIEKGFSGISLTNGTSGVISSGLLIASLGM